MEQKSRSHCFTVFGNLEEGHNGVLYKYVEDTLKSKGATYYVMGLEICPKSKKEHIQGYVHWRSPRAWRAVIAYIQGWHIENTKGTNTQAIEYCKKEGKWTEWGQTPTQGLRNDLTNLKKKVFEGNSLQKIVIDDVENFQQLKFVEGLQKYLPTIKKYKAKEVYWLWGETGCGKSRKANEESSDDVWLSSVDLKWFDGYFGQKDVIFDDFRGDFCTFHMLLRLLDGYPMKVPVKGGFVDWIPERIWITSSYKPELVYKTREDIGQLLRRITRTTRMEQGTEVGGNTNPDRNLSLVEIIDG